MAVAGGPHYPHCPVRVQVRDSADTARRELIAHPHFCPASITPRWHWQFHLHPECHHGLHPGQAESKAVEVDDASEAGPGVAGIVPGQKLFPLPGCRDQVMLDMSFHVVSFTAALAWPEVRFCSLIVLLWPVGTKKILIARSNSFFRLHAKTLRHPTLRRG